MAPSACLFSRARPGQKAPTKKIRGFMSLPGEIRNMIYAYCFLPAFRCEFAAQGTTHFPSPQTRTVKLWAMPIYRKDKLYRCTIREEPEDTVAIRISRPLGKYTVIEGLKTNWLASLCALHLVCRQVNVETTSFLYNKTVFFFDAPKRIDAFLTMVPQTKLKFVTKLQLQYIAYGHPGDTCNRVWQDKHLESWKRACRSAAKRLITLKSLEVWLYVPDMAPKFSLREPWLAPLLHFRRLTLPKSTNDTLTPFIQTRNLVHVMVHVRTRLSACSKYHFDGSPALISACTELHVLFGEAINRAILGANEEEAMARFNGAWERKYNRWHHHLQFARTGW
ncbi:hypothetical protein T440DRAFT_244249 [Plenodomus tracheiphilus IPT5]|uniref:DUF7730 domain-containing protein n=1 Tax=Plenodomus tracheiphilus IPT5 TaxID=1408161 RepID=A0A6A7BJ85_9PLEO|nr:hypothetical protein T440DRAFT_244249 [Plenodomus tracheiphilus IPT5]